MESAVFSIIKQRENIIKAAYWNTPDQIIIIHDRNYCAFLEVMKYRKKVAVAYLQSDNDFEKDELLKIFDDCNSNLREILCL